MNKFRCTIKVLAIAIFMFAFASLAQAQADRTWVSGVGDDANPCSRTAPCKTFAGSISKTIAGGEINCLDSGGFGAVTITKSITIKCEGVIGGIAAAGVSAITINDAGSGTPGTAIVTLSGLDLEGLGSGVNGINFISGGTLHVHKTQIRNFRASGSGGNGISFTPSSGTPELYVADSYITDNGSPTTTGGILIKPTGSASVMVTVNRTQVENNAVGIRVDTSSTTGTIRGVVRDSMVSGSTNNGITAVSTATVATLMVDHVSVVGNNFGLVVNGLNATLIANNTSVTANNTGLFVNVAGGKLVSYRNNAVDFNAVNGTFTDFLTPE
jgi:hypothetical protein